LLLKVNIFYGKLPAKQSTITKGPQTAPQDMHPKAERIYEQNSLLKNVEILKNKS